VVLFSNLVADNRYAFIYSNNIDDTFINFYDKVVVDADMIDNIYAIRYPKKMVAYVSLGEIEPWRKSQKRYKKSWVISKNKTWNSLIADFRKKEYQDFLLDRINMLYKKGYRNFFLDTMDAYHVIAKDKKLFKEQQRNIINFIHQLHRKYPKSKIIINRGFELLEQIHLDIDAIVAESLIARYDHNKKEYTSVPKRDREWLLNNFKKAKKLGLKVISIEYSGGTTKERLDIAKKVRELGVIPYVTDGLLQNQGECDIKRIRRNILILFNRSVFKDKNEVYSDVHLITSMPLEHFGYIPILYDISTKELPKRVEDRYSAVLIWSDGKTKNDERVYEWAKMVKKSGIKILFLKNFVFNPTQERLREFGLKINKNRNSILKKGRVVYYKPYKPYEIKASIEHEEELINGDNLRPIVEVKYKNGQTYTPIAITPWGGYAIGDSFLLSIGDESFWTVNPFKFLKDTLRLNNPLVPDPTTEAGRRELFVHIDGDGFVERVRTDMDRLSPETLIEQIYKKYKIPQSVSIIQGEVDTIGMFPKLSPKMKKIAKKLYSIPWIEPASHSFSHPFFWTKAIQPKNSTPKAGKNYHLAIPNYHFSLRQETIGSIKFAQSFAPKYKRDNRVLFWSGDCLPPKSVLSYIERAGILAMNGGDTTIDKSSPWLSHIAPFGLQRDEYWQIYTAQQNENIFTNEWTGPFWGFRHVIETFQLTEKPRRIKAINIYYHLYSGSRIASLKALDEVYSWAVKQKTSKLYASQYIKKVKDFYHTSMAKISQNRYEIRNNGDLRTVRVDKRVKVDIENSIGVAGFNYEGERTYIILDRRERHTIVFTNRINTPYLIDSNGWVERVEGNRFKLKSNIPIEANFYMPKVCSIKGIDGVEINKKREILSITSKDKKGVTIEFKCK
jgi:hypothetical protein